MSKELENKYVLARRAYTYEHFNEAYSYYKEILDEAPGDYEAAFRLIISRVHISTLASFEEVYRSLAFEARDILRFETIKQLDSREKLKVVTELERDFTKAIIVCEQAVTNHYLQFQSLPESLSEFRGRMIKLSSACGCFGEGIYDSFDDEEIKALCVNPLKNAILGLKKSAAGIADVLNSGSSRLMMGRYTSKIKEFDENYVNPCYETMRSNSGSSNRTSGKKQDTSGRTFLFGAAVVSLIGAVIAFACEGTIVGAMLLVLAVIACIMAPFFVF